MKPATQKQINFMEELGIDFQDEITIEEASELIQERLEDLESSQYEIY